ncbi:hypothetical protein EVA_19443 [gut metagenome]|uniref:Uncharacterized protein n=1 Tax=gut metagenome TaxID=749906 RepID=J9FDF8_9ZZZZ
MSLPLTAPPASPAPNGISTKSANSGSPATLPVRSGHRRFAASGRNNAHRGIFIFDNYWFLSST